MTLALERIEIKGDVIRRLLTSPEIERDLLRRAKAIAEAAGEGYEADSRPGHHRARATVWTATPAAMMDEAIDHTLLRCLDAGRG